MMYVHFQLGKLAGEKTHWQLADIPETLREEKLKAIAEAVVTSTHGLNINYLNREETELLKWAHELTSKGE